MRGSSFLFSFLFVLTLIHTSNATHFRYGNIVWSLPDADNYPTLVEFKITLSYELNLFSLLPTVGSILSPGFIDYGDGTREPISLVVSLLDNIVDLLQGTYTTRHYYPVGTFPRNFTVSHYTGGRYAFLKNNPFDFYNISTLVNLNQYVSGRRGLPTLNQSPVASMYPIVTVYSNVVTKFSIPAYDRESRGNLIYSLSTPTDMGDSTSFQPPGLSVDNNGTITFDTNGVASGYWNTQIKISDGLAYTVVDFIIYVTIPPITVPCLSAPLIQGASIDLYVGVDLNLQIQSSLLSNTILSSILPSTISLNVQLDASLSLFWRPTIKDKGSYPMVFGCRNSNLLGSTLCPASCQVSFVVNVLEPICGLGTIEPLGCNISTSTCGCKCPNGYDPLTNCSTCKIGFYGTNCTQCQCVRGTCAQGMSGSGLCTCEAGWRGIKCDIPTKPCNFNLPGYIRQVANTTTSIITPTVTNLVVTGVNTLVNLTASVPLVPPKIDILVVVDTTLSVNPAYLLNLQGALAATFITGAKGLSPSVYLGLSTFTNPTTCLLSLDVNLKLSLTANVDDFNKALGIYLKPSLALFCNVKPPGSQLNAIITATGSAAGWRSDAYKIIVLVTESTFGEGGTYDTRSDVRKALLALNAVPLFIVPSTIQSAYNSLVSDLGFGSVNSMLSNWNNAYSVALNAIKLSLNTIWTVIQQDALGLGQVVNNSLQIIPPALTTVTVAVKNVNQSLTTLSDITVNVIGWGVAILTPQVNQPPQASVVSITTREDIGTTVPLNGTDPDSDTLTVVLDSLPTKGFLYTNSTATALVRVNTTYDLPDGVAIPLFYYMPNLHFYGSDSFRFYLHDGCTRSASASANLTITFYNYPPTASDASTFTDENVNATIQLSVNDVEDTPNSLVSFIRSLPDSSLATLYHINNGSAVQINDQIAPSSLHSVRYVPKLYACCETTQFTFQVRDTGNQLSSLATVSTFIYHVNQRPTAYATSPLTVDRGVTTAITISVSDPDIADLETFTITAIGAGTYLDATQNGTITVPYNITPPVSVGEINTASQMIYYTSPPFSLASTVFSYSVTDQGGLSSAVISVTVNIKPNQNPIATAIGTVSLPYYNSSSVLYLYGTDPDPADTPTTLTVSILSLPTKGFLYVNGQNVSSAPTTFSNNASFYISGNGVSIGSDQFTFRIVDTLGGRSSLQIVAIRYVQLNRQPSGSIGTIVTRKNVEVSARINANDPDRDTLTVRILSLPTNGQLKQFDGTPISSPTALTDTSFQFRFLPGINEFGLPYTNFTFVVDDGTNSANSLSATVTATINVTDFNYPPNAISANVSIPQDSGANNITLSTYDIETPTTTVAIILSLPSASAGVLTGANGNPLTVGSTISSPWIVRFTPAARYVGAASFQFKANDGSQDSTNIGTFSISVTRVNFPPFSQVYLGTATRQVSFPINLIVGDPNIGDNLTITVQSYGGRGVFSYPDTRSRAVFPTVVPFNLPYTVTVPQSGSSSLVLNYLAPSDASGKNYANFSFYVIDQTNLRSAVTNVSIDIATNNNPPGANATSITVIQDQTSAPVTLSGYDVDVADQEFLQIYVTVLPSKGYLTQGSGNITTAPTLITGPITYTTYERGVDSFYFVVMDTLNSSSNAMLVPITITPVNHPPTLSVFGLPLNVQEATTITLSQIVTFDQDGDVVTVYVKDLPTLGNLTQFDGTPISAPNTAITDSQNRVIYISAGANMFSQNTSFSLYASDNTGSANSNTSIVIVPVNIIHIPRPPVVYDSSVSLAFGSLGVDVTLNVTDPDTPIENVTITILSVPDPNIGYLEYNSVEVKVGDVIPYNFTVTIVLNGTYGYTYFSFSASDGTVQSSTHATFGIGIRSPINSPPIAIVASDSLVAQRSVPLSIVIGAHDDDYLEVFTFVVEVQAAGGSFAFGNSNLVPPTFNITANQDLTNYITNTMFTFTAPVLAVGDNYLVVKYTVYDTLYDSSQTIEIDVGIAPNNPPVATPPPTVIFDEETNSTGFSLTGYDSDPADANNLLVSITSLPSKGALYIVGGGPVVIGQLYPQTTQFFIIGGPLQFGDDSFTYHLVDNLGGTSADQQASISITHVNHPPTGSIHLLDGVMNNPLTMQIYGQDVDPDSFITAYITQLPTLGYLTQSDGTVITSASPSNPVLVTSGSGNLIYIPPTYVYGQNLSTISFFVADNSGALNNRSVTYTVPINIAKGDLPPVAYDSNVNVNDGGPVSIPLNVSDPQGYSFVATITQFPISGTLYRSDGSMITSDNPIVGSDNIVVYVAANGTFGQTFTFSYQVSSPQSGLSSSQASISTTVLRVYRPPTYSGLTAVSIPENTEANILFSASSEADFYSVQILNTPNNGTLVVVNNDGSVTTITGIAPYLLNNSNSENRVKYLPPTNTYGENLVYITIQVVDIHGVSAPVNVTISVYHINIPPTVVPTTYQTAGVEKSWTGIVAMNENDCSTIAWDLYDPDSLRANLSSTISSLPFRGALYRYLEDGSQGVKMIQAQGIIRASSDGLFRVIYCPDLGKSGNNFASFSIMGSDNIAVSSRQYVNLRVIHINVPPMVNVTQPNWNTSVSQETLITGVSVTDADAKIFKIKLVLTLGFVDDSGQTLQTDASNIKLSNYDDTFCDTTTASVTCIATVDKLNTFLNQITLGGQTSSGTATITVFVDDMADGGNIEDARNATDFVFVTVIPNDVQRSPGNNNVLTAAVASAAVAGAAVAVGVYAYMRKRSPPTSTFFGLDQGLANGVLNENPLYEGGITVDNSLYRAPTFGMQKL